MNKDANILVVDDDQISVEIVTEILKQEGYSTIACQNGETALENIKHHDFDLVLLDVFLGTGMDGFQTCQAIQRENKDLPVILVTASQDEESIRKGFLIGSSDYIRKPVSRLELLARVNKTISYKRSEKRNLGLIYDLSKDLETAAKIQSAMLPKWVQLDANIMFSSHYEAYEAVGGDVFDRIKINDELYVVYLGDISGHGVQAALLMTAVKSLIKYMVDNNRDNLDLPLLVTKLNKRLSMELFIFDNYLTLLIGIVDLKKKEFRYLNAGHPPLIVIDVITGEPAAVQSPGSMPLGWKPHYIYNESDMGSIDLTDQQIILLFSDGIYECVNAQGDQFGIDGLLSVLQNDIKVDSCVSLPFRIRQYLEDQKYIFSYDDFSLLAFQPRRNPTESNPTKNATTSQPVHYMITLGAALQEVGKTAQAVEELIQNWKGDSILAAKVELIVDEFLNNIIKYGYKYQSDAAIVVEFHYQDESLVIRFWDKGIEWKPEDDNYTINNPYDFENDAYNVSGKGVKIIMSMSNKFHRTRYGLVNETAVVLKI